MAYTYPHIVCIILHCLTRVCRHKLDGCRQELTGQAKRARPGIQVLPHGDWLEHVHDSGVTREHLQAGLRSRDARSGSAQLENSYCCPQGLLRHAQQVRLAQESCSGSER